MISSENDLSAAHSLPDAMPDEPDTDQGTGLYWVAAYLIDLCHGGPEEGGWFYEAGTLVIDPVIYETLGSAPAGFCTIEAARIHASSMQAKLAVINHGRPEISQSNSIGIYETRIMRAQIMPTHFPVTRPHYE